MENIPNHQSKGLQKAFTCGGAIQKFLQSMKLEELNKCSARV